MTITGLINLFVETKKTSGSVFKTFSTSISSKGRVEGEYYRKSMEVRFNTENIPTEKLYKLKDNEWYELEIEEGWLGVRQYQDKEDQTKSVFYIFVNKGTLKEAHKKKPKDKPANDDLPF